MQEHSEVADEDAETRDEQSTTSSDGTKEPSAGFEQREGDVAVESSRGTTIHGTDASSTTVDTGAKGVELGSSESSTVQTVGRGECEEEDLPMGHREPPSNTAEHVGEAPAIGPPPTADAGPDTRRGPGVPGCTTPPGRAVVEDQAAEGMPHGSNAGAHRTVHLSNKLMFALD